MPPSGEVAIGAVIAAAGFSTRMGTPKQLLPWGERTVIETVVANLSEAGAEPVICVVGHLRHEMEAALADSPATVVFNQAYTEAEMLSSYQAGIHRLVADKAYAELSGVLLSLGDQPHVGPEIIRQVIGTAAASPKAIVIPSFNMRRGHPIYLPRRLWNELLAFGIAGSLRQLLHTHARDIVYAVVGSDAILSDMDTPADYERLFGQRI